MFQLVVFLILIKTINSEDQIQTPSYFDNLFSKYNSKEDFLNYMKNREQNKTMTTPQTISTTHHGINIIKVAQSRILPPYIRCDYILSKVFSSNQLYDERGVSADCYRDILQVDLIKGFCGIFPACDVEWDFQLKVPNVTCNKNKVLIIVTTLIVLSFVIVVSNCLVTLVIIKTKKLRTPQGLFKLSLAVSGFLLGGIYLPSCAYNILNGIHYDERDRFQAFGQVSLVKKSSFQIMMNLTGLNSSHLPTIEKSMKSSDFIISISIIQPLVAVYSLFLLAFDRFLSVSWPMKYRVGEIMTKRRAVYLILATWLFAVIVSLTPKFLGRNFLPSKQLITFTDVMVFGKAYQAAEDSVNKSASNQTETAEEKFIWKEYWHAIVFSLIVWVLPFIATWFFTIGLMVKSQTMLNRMRHSRRTRNGKTFGKVDRGLTLTVITSLILFTLTSLPLFAVILDSAINPHKACIRKISAIGLFTSFYLYTVSSFTNLLIYNVFQKEFRQSASNIFNLSCIKNIKSNNLSKRHSRNKSVSSKRSLTSTISNTIANSFSSVTRKKNKVKKEVPGFVETNNEVVVKASKSPT